MIRRIRELMATPFARPPGRRSVWARYAPEWCALAVYVPLSLSIGHRILIGDSPYGSTLTSLLVYGLDAVRDFVLPVWALLIIGPLVSGALAWPRERDMGTLDALTITSIDTSALALGRFWHTFLPWCRFLVWMLPVYFLMSGFDVFRWAARGDTGFLLLAEFAVFGTPPTLLGIHLSSSPFHNAGPLNAVAVVLSLFRWLNDFSIPFFACAFAYYSGARSSSQPRAALKAGTLVPLTFITVLAIHDWLLLAWPVWSDTIFGLYAVTAPAASVARWVLGFALLRRAARDFHLHTPDRD